MISPDRAQEPVYRCLWSPGVEKSLKIKIKNRDGWWEIEFEIVIPENLWGNGSDVIRRKECPLKTHQTTRQQLGVWVDKEDQFPLELFEGQITGPAKSEILRAYKELHLRWEM